MSSLSHEPSFSFRSLKESELEGWFDHVATVFAQTPRSYFVDHFQNDPNRNLNCIFVAIDEAVNPPVIAATVRVFDRNIYLGGKVVKTGGIGEVSTKEAYRGKHLAKRLLEDSIKFMKENGYAVSTLHTGAAAPVYEKHGWKDFPREGVLRTIDSLQGNDAANAGWTVENADLNDEDQLKKITDLHREYSIHFSGPFERSLEYWKKWIASEVSRSDVKIASWLLNAAKERVAFVLVGYKPRKTSANCYIVRSFAVNNQLYQKDLGRDAFHFLLKRVMEEKKGELPHPASHLMYPAPLFDEHGSCETDLQLKIQNGGMYLALSEESRKELEENLTLEKHVFWDADGF
eukprot:TRINITY_DN730_c0_g1_i1.p1 TRINITY_DN730_c0_g1~~TRINITY_DN730_c0_g1_i1.p1  ORF type:complete len:346 (-),score=104.26 TRINITY_DN730_c0_g1_i1:269-1306(-)